MDGPAAGSHSARAAAEDRSAVALVRPGPVELADLSVMVSASDRARAEAIAHELPVLPASSRPPELAVTFGSRAIPLPEREPDEVYDDLSVWRHDDVLHLLHASGVRASATPAGLELGGHGTALAAAFHRLIQPGLAHCLAYHDRFLVHAGAVVRDDRAVLLCGGTGRGKSTLSLAALLSGWHLVADDLVVLRRRGASVEVTGIPKPAAVPGDLGPTPPGAVEVPGDPRGRWRLPAEQLLRGWHPLGAVVVVEHAEGPESELRRLPGSALATHVVPAFPSAGNPPLLRRFFALAMAATRTPAFELRHAADAARRLAGARAGLDEVARAAAA